MRGKRGDRGAVRPRERAHPDDHQRVLGLLQHIAEFVPARRHLFQRLRPGAEIVVRISEVGPLADEADGESRHSPALADAGVDDGRFAARIGADEQQRIGLLDPGNAGVEEIRRPPPFRVERGTVLPAVEIDDAQPRHQILQRKDFLDRGKIADDGADALGIRTFDLGCDGVEGVAPGGRMQLPILANVGLVEALGAQSVDHMAGLVGNPFLVHGVVDARQDAHDLAPAGIDADGRADRVHDVDQLGLVQLPRPRGEGIGLGRERADRAEIDHVALQLGGHRLLEIGRDLHVLAAADGAELRHAGDLGHEPDAARAVDAAVHDGLDEDAHILVLDRALVLVEAAGIDAVGHGLVLQVAFAALVADRAVERVIDQQELHHPFARLAHHRRLGDDLGQLALRPRPAVAHAPGARRDRLGRALELDQAHAAIAGDRQPLVEAEARDFRARGLAGLEQRVLRRDVDLLAVDDELGHPSVLRSVTHIGPISITARPAGFPSRRQNRSVRCP